MNNTQERERRSKLMKKISELNNKNPEYHKILSDSAKKTSSRPDILAIRSNNLKKWRENNPEDFAKIVEILKISAPKNPTWFSKPEKILFLLVNKIEGFNFKFNQVVKSNNFDWLSKRKQIDMADKNKNIYIEFDGPTHFNCWGNEAKFAEVKRRDYLLNNYMIENQFMIIRISYDQFIDKRKKGGFFKPECVIKLIELLNTYTVGVFTIGDKYGQY